MEKRGEELCHTVIFFEQENPTVSKESMYTNNCSWLIFKNYLRCKFCQLCAVELVVTGSDHTQPALLHHLTAAVLIGDPGGHAHPTCLRAGAPLCGLLNAIQAGIPTVKTHSFLLTIGWRDTEMDRRAQFDSVLLLKIVLHAHVISKLVYNIAA